MNDRKLEAYLEKLEKALAGIPVGDRAEIVTEIRSHVQEARAQHPERPVDEILRGLGDPAAVAERYRTERGFASTPVRRSAFRTVALAMAAMILVTFAAVTALAWRAWPLLRVSDSGVQILGGAIDVRADDFDDLDDETGTELIEGRLTTTAGTEAAEVRFKNGKVEVKTSATDELRWRCRVKGATKEPETVGRTWKLDLSESRGLKCTVAVPAKWRTVVLGTNGKVDVERPRGPVDVKLDNGKIDFEPDLATKYRIDADVRNGSKDSFAGLDGPNAVPVKLALANGKISRD